MTPGEEAGPAADLRLWAVEELISRVLFLGGVISIAVILLGMAVYLGSAPGRAEVAGLAQLREGRPAGVFVSVGEIARGVTRHPMDPLALVALGLVLLMITPLVGVAVAVPAFLSIRDYRYVVVAGIVLAVLLVSLFLGGAG